MQLLKNTKTLKSDKSLEQNAAKIIQLETELKEALAKIKELENSKEREEKTEKKVRFGDVPKESDTLKAKTNELNKLKLQFVKVKIVT